MAKVIVSQNLKGCKVSGHNLLENGSTIRKWEGTCSGRMQFATGNRKCFWVSGPKGGWLNPKTFTGTVGTYTYKNLPENCARLLHPKITVASTTVTPKPAVTPVQAVTIGSQPTVLVINSGDTHSLTQLQSWIQAQLQAVKA